MTLRLLSFLARCARKTRRSRREHAACRARPLGEGLESRHLLTAVTMSDHEQLLLELVNRARLAPVEELNRYPEITDLNDGLPTGAISTAPKQPLAPNAALTDMAMAHSQDMLDNDYFSHTNLEGDGPQQRAINAGYSGTVGENVAWGGTTSTLLVTEQVEKRHKSLFLSDTHRLNMLGETYREAGMGVVTGQFTTRPPVTSTEIDWNAVMITEALGWTQDNHFITGVAYSDTVIDDDFYSVGEGLSDLAIVAVNQSSGTTFTTSSGPSGGYVLQVPNGVYEVTASGAGLTNSITYSNVTVNSWNVKLDFDPTSTNDPPPPPPPPPPPGNRPPVAVPDFAATNNVASVTTDVLANDTDPDDDPLSLVANSVDFRSAIRSDTGAQVPLDSATLSETGNAITFDPGTDFDFLTAGESATVQVGYTVTDGSETTTFEPAGSATGLPLPLSASSPQGTSILQLGTIPSDAESVRLTLMVSDPDQASEGRLLINNAQSTLLFGEQGVPANDGQTVSITLLYPISAFQSGTNTLAFSHEATSGYEVEAIVAEYVVGAAATAEGTLTITVNSTATNVAPVANPDTAVTSADSQVSVDVIANDTDADGDELQLVQNSASIRSATRVDTGASIILNDATISQSGNSVTFHPGTDFAFLDEGQAATVLVDYTVTDDSTISSFLPAASATGAPLTLNAANAQGTALLNLPSIPNDATGVRLTLTAHDADRPDEGRLVINDTEETFLFGSQGLAEHDGQLADIILDFDLGVFQPGTNTLDFFHDATAGFRIDNIEAHFIIGSATTDNGTLTITVNGVAANAAPVAHPDSAVTDQDSSVTVDVIANDTDANGDTLSLVGTSVGIRSASRGDGTPINVSTATVSASSNLLTFNPGSDFDFLTGNETATVLVDYLVTDGAATADFVPAGNGTGLPQSLDAARPQATSQLFLNSIPPDATAIKLTLTAWDADREDEGRLLINGSSETLLFGDQGVVANDGTTTQIELMFDISHFQQGVNSLQFSHNSTAGFRIDAVSAAYLVGATSTDSGQLTVTVTAATPTTAGVVGRTDDGTWWVTRNGTPSSTTPFGNWVPGIDWQDVRTLDFNGDGLTDIVARGGGSLWLAESTQESYFTTRQVGAWSTSTNWANVTVGDFNGDGRDDLAARHDDGSWWVSISDGVQFQSSRWGHWSTNATWADVAAMDPDGDGVDDIIGRASDGSWWLARSDGSKFQNLSWGHWTTKTEWQDVQVADVNGDGRQDIVGRDATTGWWWVGLSDGTRFSPQRWEHWSTGVEWRDVLVADVNGDGRDDIAGRTSGTWWVAVSTGTDFVSQPWGQWAAGDWQYVQVLDIDDDGDDDLLGRFNGDWWVGNSNGTGLQNQFLANWSTQIGWSDVSVGIFTTG